MGINLTDEQLADLYPGGVPGTDGYQGQLDPRLFEDENHYVGDQVVKGCERCGGGEEAAVTFTLSLDAWLCRRCVRELGESLTRYVRGFMDAEIERRRRA